MIARLLAGVAASGAATTFVAARHHRAALAAFQDTDESWPLFERLRADICQVATKSRGRYLAADGRQAEGTLGTEMDQFLPALRGAGSSRRAPWGTACPSGCLTSGWW